MSAEVGDVGEVGVDGGHFLGLNFEARLGRRLGARHGLAKMYRVPPVWTLWPAVGPNLNGGVGLLH